MGRWAGFTVEPSRYPPLLPGDTGPSAPIPPPRCPRPRRDGVDGTAPALAAAALVTEPGTPETLAAWSLKMVLAAAAILCASAMAAETAEP